MIFTKIMMPVLDISSSWLVEVDFLGDEIFIFFRQISRQQEDITRSHAEHDDNAITRRIVRSLSSRTAQMIAARRRCNDAKAGLRWRHRQMFIINRRRSSCFMMKTTRVAFSARTSSPCHVRRACPAFHFSVPSRCTKNAVAHGRSCLTPPRGQ